ncbi:alpha/beta fold hydrolase [Marinicellulosiphila megalodicopiae]|uniref:alpha/beta fold hydrolase n=1 Tax=Marinicellulosiphila megalodicopiae TaxID=2724896 RepID=UPI003BAEB33B
MSTKIYAIPGTFCNENVWDELKNNLPSDIEIINIEIPFKKSVDNIVDSLNTLLPKGAFNLLGFSFGGYLASAFAIKYPHRVEKLMVVSDALDKLENAEINNRKQYAEIIKEDGFKGLDSKTVMGVLHPTKKYNTQLRDKIISMSHSMSDGAAQNQLLATNTRKDCYKKIGQLASPVWFVVGDTDKTVNNKIISKVVSKSHNFELKQINQSGHFLPLEQPEKLAEIVTNWLVS